MFRRRTTAKALTAGAVAALMLASAATPALATDITAPRGILVQRDVTTPTTLNIGWKPQPGTDHVRVSVFDGTTDAVTTYPTDVLTDDFVGAGECTRYQVRISGVAADGTAAAAGTVLVNSLAPGGLGSITSERTDAGTTGRVSWTAPAWWGSGADPAYSVKVTESSSGRVLVDETTPGTSVTVPEIDPGRQYVVKVTPVNSYGGCFTSSQLLRAGKPSPPHGLAAARTDVPSTIRLTWNKPAWEGYGAITHYRVYYGDSIVSKTIDVTDNEVTIEGFNPEKDSKFQVVAYDGDLRGEPSASFTLLKIGAAGEKELDPLVRITESDGFIRATIEGPVGSSTTYPDLFLDVNPASPSSTYTEHHQVANRATALTFDKVPCGVFTVAVTGQGEAGSKEFGRVLVNRCQVGELDRSMWRLVYGRAAIAGNVVDMDNGSETRVISQKPMTQQDMALTTRATLRAGWGYGIWLRAHLPTNANNASVSGYTMQYDPGYGRINSFGPALLLRVWDTGRECSTPLARVKWPVGLEVNSQHLITAVVQGDALWMSINGTRLFAVPSLSAAMASSGCAAGGFKEPSGNQIGFRTWGTGTSAVFEESTLN
jgi:hypothetical protein